MAQLLSALPSIPPPGAKPAAAGAAPKHVAGRTEPGHPVPLEGIPVPAWSGSQGPERGNLLWREEGPAFLAGLSAADRDARSGRLQQSREGPVAAEYAKGDSHWVEVVGPAHGAPGAEGDGLVGVLVDVTPLARRLAHAATLDADRKGVFMNEAAHELRNPLTPLVMQLQLLLAAPTMPPERREHSLQVALRSAQRLEALLGDILEVTRLHGGKRPIQRAPLDLREAIAAGLSQVEPLARERGVKLEAQLDGELGVVGDRTRLGNVSMHLVRNAVQASSEGSTVKVLGVRRSGMVGLQVADQGKGLDAQQLAKLHEPFARVHAGQDGGSGLGLTFARDVLEALGGRLEVASPGPGEGCTVTAWLPESALDQRAEGQVHVLGAQRASA